LTEDLFFLFWGGDHEYRKTKSQLSDNSSRPDLDDSLRGAGR
jgi:hypothetical protein